VPCRALSKKPPWRPSLPLRYRSPHGLRSSGVTRMPQAPMLPQLLYPPDESDNFTTQRPQRGRNTSLPVHAIFQSSSAPPGFQAHTPPLARGYSRRAESVSVDGDHDATVRRKRKVSDADAEPSASGDRMGQAEGKLIRSIPCRCAFLLTSRTTNSSAKVSLATSKAGSFCLATLFYGLDSATSGVQHSQTQCRTGGKGSRSRVC
jgi:hypothetical protein